MQHQEKMEMAQEEIVRNQEEMERAQEEIVQHQEEMEKIITLKIQLGRKRGLSPEWSLNYA